MRTTKDGTDHSPCPPLCSSAKTSTASYSGAVPTRSSRPTGRTAPEEEQVLAQPSLQSGFPYDLDLRRIASAERSQARRLFFDLLSNTPR
jgi:hypothetical protein